MSVDELLPRAKELKADGPVPSINALQKTLRVGFRKAHEVHQRLTEEAAAARSRRAAGRRAALKRLSFQKNPDRRPAARRQVLPASPATTPASPVTERLAETVPEEVGKNPATAVTTSSEHSRRRVATWPLQLIALPAYVAIWAGWVALGKMTAFGKVTLLPGVSDFEIDTAITLPIGAEAYAAYAMYVLFHAHAPARARRFAAWSAGAALLIGMGGQVAYHLMAAAGMTVAPWQITTVVSCLPVAVLGAAAALVRLIRTGEDDT